MELVDSVVVCTLSSCTGSGFLLLCGVALRKETGAIATWVVDGVLHGLLMACFMGLHAGPVCVGTHLICC
jgi:hypothetical protein